MISIAVPLCERLHHLANIQDTLRDLIGAFAGEQNYLTLEVSLLGPP